MNLNQITIPALDVEKSMKFYQLLGLKLIVHSHADYVRFECPDGNSSFSIQKASEISKGLGIKVYFELESLDEKVDELIAKGLDFDEMPNDKPWLWREAHLTDPDNHHIILYHAGKNRLNPPWRLT